MGQTPEGAAKPKKKTRKMIGRKLKNRLKYSRKDLLLRRQGSSFASVVVASWELIWSYVEQLTKSGWRRIFGMRSGCI